jgi:ribosomal protein S12 methylthiotransferase
LMAAQQEIAFAWNKDQIGRRVEVLIDAAVPKENTAWIGRSYADAPDVDGVVYVTGERLSVGAMVTCEVVGTSGYDLVAVAVDEPR